MQLSASQRQIWALHEDGVPRRHIANRLGIGRAYVSVQLTRVRSALGIVGTKSDPTCNFGEDETPREARARVARDLIAGRRCPRCWLLLPHDDCSTRSDHG